MGIELDRFKYRKSEAHGEKSVVWVVFDTKEKQPISYEDVWPSNMATSVSCVFLNLMINWV